MGVWSKIVGTIETVFQIGIGGPQLKANAGVIEARNAADNAFVKMRALDPAAASDVATKNYVDTGASGGSVRCVRYVIGTAASLDSATVIPANAIIHRALVSVTTPYSAGATIAVGQAGSTSLLIGTTDNNPLAAGIYELDLDTSWGAGALAVRTTIGGAPAAGASVVSVFWSLPTA